MSKQLRIAVFGLFLGLFGLFSCSNKNPTSSAGNESMDGFGKAVVQLPDLSSSLLKKTAVGIDSNALTLLIVASDMDTLKYSWPIDKLTGQTVTIEGIKAGDNRIFEGFLTNKSGIITHSGKVAVKIIAGEVVPVHLKLFGSGGAEVCIEIDGYPSSCSSTDSLYINSCIGGFTIYDSLTGEILLAATSDYATGHISFTSPTSKGYYVFEKPLQVLDSAGQKSCHGIVTNTETGKTHGLNLSITESTGEFYGYILDGSDVYGTAIVKFYNGQCQSTVDSINVNTCLTGSSIDGPVTGNIQLGIYNSNPFGRINFFADSINRAYAFKYPVQITYSGNIKHCNTIVIDLKTGRLHGLNMTINEKSEIDQAYLCEDSSISSSAIIKFYSVPCVVYDTLNINSCLSGYTPKDTLNGKIQLQVKNNNSSGQFTIAFSTSKDTYFFNRPVQVSNSNGNKNCKTIVQNAVTKRYHALNMEVNQYSEITYAYLSADTNFSSEAIAKFFSVKCSDPVIDTIIVKVAFKGTFPYPDTGRTFTSTMDAIVYGQTAYATFNFKNFPAIKPNPAKATGSAVIDNTGSGYMDLMVTSQKIKITIKIDRGDYYASIYDEKGRQIGYMTGNQ